MNNYFHDRGDPFAYQFWFKLTGSFLQILVKICVGAFVYCFHDSYCNQTSADIRLLRKRLVKYDVTFDIRALQATIPRSGNEYFSKTLEAHISRMIIFFTHFFTNMFKISFCSKKIISI